MDRINILLDDIDGLRDVIHWEDEQYIEKLNKLIDDSGSKLSEEEIEMYVKHLEEYKELRKKYLCDLLEFNKNIKSIKGVDENGRNDKDN